MLNYLLLIFLVEFVAGEYKKKNFVIILTDDQDVTLDGMTPMVNVQKFLAKEGVTFTKSFVTSPICCPSRASLLSGQYMHNHHTYNNSVDGGCYGHTWTKRETDTFPAILQQDGYKTFYAGKYLNQYGTKAGGGPERVPPGWSEWHGLVGNSVYYDYTLSHNGKPKHYTQEYLTDVIRDLAVSYIEKQKGDEPFLMILAPPAPHQPFTPAPRHQGKFANITVLKQPNFNITAHDKHWLLRMPPSPLPYSLSSELDHAYRSRWEALLAVDEMVADVVTALDEHSILDDTYVVFTSDNGYHIGQFSQVYDKRQPYESDIKVPLIIKGPGIPRGVASDQPVLNIDLAPTILNLANSAIPSNFDGNIITLSNVSSDKDRYMLVEYKGEGHTESVNPKCPWKYDGDNLAQCRPEYECKCQDAKNNTYTCVRRISRHLNFKYCVFFEFKNTTFEEVYDLEVDEFELNNIRDEVLPATRWWYKDVILPELSKCQGHVQCNKDYWDML